MDELLDDTVTSLNSADTSLLENLREDFFDSMINAYKIFGDSAFRKANFINKSLFLGLSRVLRKYQPEEIDRKDVQAIKNNLKQAILQDDIFSNALSMATNDARNVKIVFNKINEIMENS